MREGILIGRKGDKAKAISDVLPFDQARKQLADLRSDSKAFGSNEIVELWKPVGVKSVVKAVVEAREKENTKLAEAEAVKDDTKTKSKAKAALVGLALFMFAFSATAQQSILGYLASTTVQGTNTSNSQEIRWQPNDVITAEVVVTTTYDTTDDTNAITITLDESLGGTYWTAATQTKTVNCTSTTNGTVSLFTITNTLGTLRWRVTQVERVDNTTNTATINQFLIYRPDS